MGEVIIRLMPFIIGSAVVPLQIMMVILLLSSRNRGLAKAIFLVAGMTVIRLLQGVVFGLIFSPSAGEANGKSSLVSTLLLVLGIFLLITAYKQWRGEDDPDGPPPKWMTMLDSMTPLKAFGAGAGLVLISGKFWVFTLSAIGVIEEAQLGQTSKYRRIFVVHHPGPIFTPADHPGATIHPWSIEIHDGVHLCLVDAL